MILAIDPGKDKCGLAVLDEDAKVIECKVIKRSELLAWISGRNFSSIVIGQGAFGRELSKELPSNFNLVYISEKDSTRRARERYWQENPPSGWLKLVPASLRVPPVPVDDWAAVIIGERYLSLSS